MLLSEGSELLAKAEPSFPEEGQNIFSLVSSDGRIPISPIFGERVSMRQDIRGAESARIHPFERTPALSMAQHPSVHQMRTIGILDLESAAKQEILLQDVSR
jgi:hypothetical protein